MSQNIFNQKLAQWNDRMIKKYHARGALFESKNIFLRFIERMRLKKIIRLAQLQKNDFVLDLGCGEGFLILLMPELPQKIIGLDISKTVLDRAKEILKKKKNVELKLGDAESLNFPSRFFDKIICSEMLEHVPRPRKVMEEVSRVLKNGGLFIISVPDEKRTQFFMKMMKIFHLNKILDACRQGEKYEWHLHQADKKFIINMSEGLFKIKKINRTPPVIGHRFIAVLAKK